MGNFVSEILLKSKADDAGFNAVKSSVNGLKSALGQLRSEANSVGNEFEKTLSGFNRAVLGIRTGILQTAGGFILGNIIQNATSSVIAFGKSFIDVNSQVQQFKLQFTNLFKSIGLSAEEAGKQSEAAFEFAKKVARETPFDLPEITAAILRFQTFGLEVEKFLQRSIDLASALGKPLDEVVQAFTNLQSRRFGEAFEQFARLGIARDLLEGKGLVFDRNGSYQGSVNQAMDAVTQIIDEHFGGFAKSQEGTFSQLQSNLRDLVFQFKEAIGGPIFAGLNADLQDFVNTLSENQSTINAFGQAFGELFEGARKSASDAFKGIISDLKDGQETTASDFFEFGTNVFVAFANGILEGGKFVLEAATQVAQAIAALFEAFSPPKEGPLHEIDVWGANLINTFFEGMSNADFGLLDDVLDKVKAQFEGLVGAGLIDTQTPEQDFLGLVDTIVNGFDDIQAGGEAAKAVFDQLATTLGSDVAGELEAFVASAQRIKDLTNELADAQSILDSINSQEDEVLGGLNDQLDALEEADAARRDAFNAQQEAQADAESAAREAAQAQRQAQQQAEQRQRDAIQKQIDALQESKDGIDAAKDKALDALEAQRDALLAPLEAAAQGLDDQVTQAKRALEDFNFQTEGIPERFTRQRRRDLEQILTIKQREAEDAKKDIQDQKNRINDLYDAQKKQIEANAKAQKDAIDQQIKGLRDQLKILQDINNAEEDINTTRSKREKFVPDPRIQELKDKIDLTKKDFDAQKTQAEARIKQISDELKAEKDKNQQIVDQLNTRLSVEQSIKNAIDEQTKAINDAAKAAEDAARNAPTERDISQFTQPITDLNTKIDEARAKLADLIPQETRDKFKRDIQFFADFFKGIANIKGPNFDEKNPSEGFALGAQFRDAIGRIGDAFTNDVVPKVQLFADGIRTAVGFVNDLLDGIDKIKGVFASGLDFLGLSGLADILNTPIRDAGVTLGAYLLVLRAIPGGTKLISFVFSMATKFATAVVPPIFQFLLGLLGLGGAGGGGAAETVGLSGFVGPEAAAGGGLSGALGTGLLIAIPITLLLTLAFVLAFDVGGIRTAIFNFVKEFPEFAAIIASGIILPASIPFILPIAVGFLLDKFGVFDSLGDLFQAVILDPLAGLGSTLTGLGGSISNIATSVGNGIANGLSAIPKALSTLGGNFASGAGNTGNQLLTPFKLLSDFLTGPFLTAFNTVSNFFGPWFSLVGQIFNLQKDLFLLPFKIAVDFINVTFIPLFNLIGPQILRGLQGIGSLLKDNVFDPIVNGFNGLIGFLTDTAVPDITGAAQTVADAISTPLISGFTAAINFFNITVLPFFASVGGLISGAIGSLAGGISTAISAAFNGITGLLQSVGGAISGIVSGFFTPAINFITNTVFPFFTNTVVTVFTGFVQTFQAVFAPVGDAITAGFRAAFDFFTNQLVPFFNETIPSALGNVVTAVDNFITSDAITHPFTTAKDVLSTQIIPFFTQTLPNAFDALPNKLKDPALFSNIIFNGLSDGFSRFNDFATNTLGPLLTQKIPGFFNSLGSSLSGSLSGILSSVGTFASQLIIAFVNLPGQIAAPFKDIYWTFFHFGQDILGGLADGIRDKLGDLKSAVEDALAILNPLNWDIPGRSPVIHAMMQTGQEATTAFADGLKAGIPAVTTAVNQVTQVGLGAALGQPLSFPTNGGIPISVIQPAAVASYEKQGAMAGKVFSEGFASEMQRFLASNPIFAAFLQARFSQFNFNISQASKQNRSFSTETSTQTARIITQILNQAG